MCGFAICPLRSGESSILPATATFRLIGAMIESRLGSAISAHLAAGLGGFAYVDLDIPMLLAEDPFTGGYAQDGVEYRLDPTAPGHGVSARP